MFGTTIDRERSSIAPIYNQLEPFRDRRAAALSGGMKQKLALCCALVHRPEILLLDEPTTGVDAVSRREFWDLLAQLKTTGMTIVVSTPYMDEANRCDRVALVQGGRLLAVDSPTAIAASFDRPLLAVTASRRYPALLALRESPHAQAVYPFGDTLHYVDARSGEEPSAIARELQDFLASRGFADVRIEPTHADSGGQLHRADGRGGRHTRGMSGAPAIAVEKLTRRFGAFTAVDGISFDVRAGRGVRFSRRQRRRQDNRDPDADRPAGADQRTRDRRRARCRARAPSRSSAASAT